MGHFKGLWKRDFIEPAERHFRLVLTYFRIFLTQFWNDLGKPYGLVVEIIALRNPCGSRMASFRLNDFGRVVLGLQCFRQFFAPIARCIFYTQITWTMELCVNNSNSIFHRVKACEMRVGSRTHISPIIKSSNWSFCSWRQNDDDEKKSGSLLPRTEPFRFTSWYDWNLPNSLSGSSSLAFVMDMRWDRSLGANWLFTPWFVLSFDFIRFVRLFLFLPDTISVQFRPLRFVTYYVYPSIFLLWFALSCNTLTVLIRPQDRHNINIAPPLTLKPSLFFRLKGLSQW